MGLLNRWMTEPECITAGFWHREQLFVPVCDSCLEKGGGREPNTIMWWEYRDCFVTKEIKMTITVSLNARLLGRIATSHLRPCTQTHTQLLFSDMMQEPKVRRTHKRTTFLSWDLHQIYTTIDHKQYKSFNT